MIAEEAWCCHRGWVSWDLEAVGRRDRHLRRAALKNCEMPVAPWVAVGRPASRLSSWQTTDCPPAPSLIGLSRNHLRQAQQTDSCFCKCQMDALDAVVTCHLNHSSRKYLLSGPSPIMVYPCNSLTDSLLFSKLDWIDPGVWRCQLKTCWGCWYYLKKLLWLADLDPRVRCAFGNVFFKVAHNGTWSCHGEWAARDGDSRQGALQSLFEGEIQITYWLWHAVRTNKWLCKLNVGHSK